MRGVDLSEQAGGMLRVKLRIQPILYRAGLYLDRSSESALDQAINQF